MRSAGRSPRVNAMRFLSFGSRLRNRLTAWFVIGSLGLTGAIVAAAVAPSTAAAFNNGCRFSQIGNYGSPLYTTNGNGTVYLEPCDGVYVNCWSTNAYGTWFEYVSWTQPYGYRFQGWIRDSDLQTFGNPPWDYWRHC